MQYIYNLIAFSEKYINAQEEYSKLDTILSKMSRQECRQYYEEQKDVFDKLFKETSIGKAYRGSFTDLDMLVKIIESQNDPYGLCEGYYNYLLIERYEANMIDGCCFGEGGCEIWYRTEYDSENFKYVRIEKPEGMKRLVNFT